MPALVAIGLSCSAEARLSSLFRPSEDAPRPDEFSVSPRPDEFSVSPRPDEFSSDRSVAFSFAPKLLLRVFLSLVFRAFPPELPRRPGAPSRRRRPSLVKSVRCRRSGATGQLSSRGRGYLPSSLHPRTHLVQTRSPIGQRSQTRTALGSGRSPG